MKEDNLRLAVELRHQLHAHPELSMKEEWTRKTLQGFLRQHTKLEIVDQGRWFYALYRAPDAGPGTKTIGFRADFDALPMEEKRPDLSYASKCSGVSHKCGHDGHAASLAGLALEIDQKGCDKNIIFFFQHAEETGEGCIECAETLKSLGIDEFYAFHNMSGFPEKSVVLRSGTIHCASVGMTVKMTGAPAHASTPEQGKSPALPIAELACRMSDLANPSLYEGILLCTIVQIDVGQKAFGVAPDRGEISMTLRAEHEAELDALIASVQKEAQALAEKNGLTCAFEFSDRFPETVNSSFCADRVRAAAKILGIPVVELPEPYRGSEDFGHVLKLIPGAVFQLSNGEDYPGVHTFEFDFRDDLIPEAVDLYEAILEE